MKTFVSTHKLFQIDLFNDWQSNYEGNLYTFYEGENGEDSALQISVAFHRGGKQFVLEEELEKVLKEHPTAHITELSEYRAVHYGLDMDGRMLQYRWITGWKNVKMFCTLTIKSQLGNQNIDAMYAKVVDILDTLKIFPPEISDENKLREVIIDQAKHFLSNAGEFFPFGAYMNLKDEIVPLGIQLEDDKPESRQVLELVERAIDLKLATGEAKIAGIGTDVFYRPPNSEVEKKSAIHVQILLSNGGTTGYYLPYKNENGSFVYERLLNE